MTQPTEELYPFIVLIPALNPDEALEDLVKQLLEQRVHQIVIVNDGSRAECGGVFSRLDAMPRCTVLHHAVNLGKGRALKTGLNHVLLQSWPCPGVVTADADGQHTPGDILTVGKRLASAPPALVIGSRSFSRRVPLRSLLGNVLTKYVFYFLVGQRLSDTQSGLRGIPMPFIPALLRLEGERYEYEMNMLLLARNLNLPMRETSVSAIYLNGNASSHFNPFFDSMKIYFVLLRFGLTSLVTTAADQLLFFLAYRSGMTLASSMVAARLGSSVINLVLNRGFVFKSRAELPGIFLRYYSAMGVAGLIAFGFIRFLTETYGWSVMIAKVTVESCLFLLSFMINRDFVFTRRQETET